MNRLLSSIVIPIAAVATSVALPMPALAGCNSGSVANTNLLDDPFCNANAAGYNATAVGRGAEARGISATSVGNEAGSLGVVEGATSIGHLAAASGAFSTAIGAGNTGGSEPTAISVYTVAIGGGDGAHKGAQSAGNASIAIGSKALRAAAAMPVL